MDNNTRSFLSDMMAEAWGPKTEPTCTQIIPQKIKCDACETMHYEALSFGGKVFCAVCAFKEGWREGAAAAQKLIQNSDSG